MTLLIILLTLAVLTMVVIMSVCDAGYRATADLELMRAIRDEEEKE